MTVLDRIIARASPAASLRRAIQLSERGRAAEAFPLLARAAKAGIVDAEYRVARCYLEGSGVPPSRAEAISWLNRAATHGCVEAQVLLGAMCLQGLAAQADAGSMTGRAALFAGDTSTAAPDFESAAKWSLMAAMAGSAEGQALLGYILTFGPEPIRDLTTRIYGMSVPLPQDVRKATSDTRCRSRDGEPMRIPCGKWSST